MGVGRPVGVAVEGARQYQRRNGLYAPDAGYSRALVSPTAIQEVARAYDRLPEFDRSALPAYHAMRREVGRQFDHLTAPRSRGGMGFQVDVSDEDPYGGVGGVDGKPGGNGIPDLFRDIGRRHISVLSTRATGGHPVFSDDENDMFRAVHDVFGHAGTGRSVDRHGEDAAYRKHAAMFSPLARAALATETRGQNHAMIAHNGEFQPQKVALLPEPMQRLGFASPRTPEERVAAITQARQFNREHGV